jgi:hypothetical protein
MDGNVSVARWVGHSTGASIALGRELRAVEAQVGEQERHLGPSFCAILLVSTLRLVSPF